MPALRAVGDKIRPQKVRSIADVFRELGQYLLAVGETSKGTLELSGSGIV